ncbi:uncharacterized protein [Apostichopus japonicus]|uniref:uncharacterized protein isoform X2 n=1 Tax=Stichopus japonicus TaxID=307972 RepID=UPI003AB7C736
MMMVSMEVLYLDPVPAFPVIEGCNHQQYCVLEKQIQDVLTCTVSGIRPKVALEWKVFRQDNAIGFSEQTVTVTQRDDRYDIILKAKLGIPSKPENKITVECVAVGENAEHFDLSTKIDVIFTNVHPTEETSVRIFLVPVVVVVVAVITVILVTLCIIMQKVRKRNMKKKLQAGNLEETLPMMKTKREFSEKETLFIGQIKSKYELLYDSVQPIPYIKDRMYCVDKVFVNGGVEFLAKIPEGGGHSRWESLGTYQDILSETCLSSKRQILEGEPGYGKSTLTLQLLYDWCQSVHTSPLINIDVVIYLRLRQLGGVNSIYSAIRQFILPKDSNIIDKDIKEMLHNMDSVLVLLDGFDEYPDQDSAETDIFHILNKNMLQGIKVVLTTRVSCLPKDFAPRTERVRLQGFDEAAHRTYIRKAVVGEDDKAVEKLMRKLQKNPLLDDLCQVPLFFVMFAHITYENEKMVTFNSVTSFFRYMISCFHSHMRIKMKDENVQKFELLENEHKALDKIAFEALSRKKQKIVWDKEKLRNELGCEFYDRYFRIGILVEEEVLDIADEVSDESHIQYKKEVRFYHKLFCEWYAAYYVAECLSATSTENVHSFLDKLDPFELQYLYRFVCGLDKIAAEKVIQYLQSKDDGKKFAVLCMLEQEEKTENFIKRVSDLVSSGVTSIGSDESKLLQRSTLQILGVASKHKIPVSCLVLDKSFANADQNEITLKSGLRVPIMLLLEKLEIRMEKGIEVTQEELLSVWRYVQQCQKLKRLSFIDCFLPASIPVEHISSVIKSRHLKVFWKPLDYEFALEIESGKWKINSEGTSKLSTEDRQSLYKLMSNTVTLSKDDSKHFQGYMIELLHNASCHKIPIYCVNLANAFKELDGDGNIILCSGLSLPILTSLEILDIQTEKGRKIGQNEVNATLEYIQYCPRFKQLMFDGCLLPSSVSLGPCLSKLESKNINVFCFPDGREGRHYKLHFQSGHWLLDPGTSSVFPLKHLERY